MPSFCPCDGFGVDEFGRDRAGYGDGITATAYAASSGNFTAGVGGRPPQHHMKTRSSDQGRTAGVGSVKRPSPEFGAMGERRRFRPFARTLSTG